MIKERAVSRPFQTSLVDRCEKMSQLQKLGSPMCLLEIATFWSFC